MVRVCENPAVLRAAAAQLGAGGAPLVCTEGRPSVACLRLLAQLADGGCELAHHGDLDWGGLRITSTLVDEVGARPWRMDAADYLDALRRLPGERPPLRGHPAASPWDPALATALAEHDRAGLRGGRDRPVARRPGPVTSVARPAPAPLTCPTADVRCHTLVQRWNHVHCEGSRT